LGPFDPKAETVQRHARATLAPTLVGMKLK